MKINKEKRRLKEKRKEVKRSLGKTQRKKKKTVEKREGKEECKKRQK